MPLAVTQLVNQAKQSVGGRSPVIVRADTLWLDGVGYLLVGRTERPTKRLELAQKVPVMTLADAVKGDEVLEGGEASRASVPALPVRIPQGVTFGTSRVRK